MSPTHGQARAGHPRPETDVNPLAARLIRIVAAACLAISGYLHAYLYDHGYRAIHRIAWRFYCRPVRASPSRCCAIHRPGAAAHVGAGLAGGALIAFLMSRTVRRFRIRRTRLQPSPQALIASSSNRALGALAHPRRPAVVDGPTSRSVTTIRSEISNVRLKRAIYLAAAAVSFTARITRGARKRAAPTNSSGQPNVRRRVEQHAAEPRPDTRRRAGHMQPTRAFAIMSAAASTPSMPLTATPAIPDSFARTRYASRRAPRRRHRTMSYRPVSHVHVHSTSN